MLHPSHSSRFYHPHNSGWAVRIIKLLIMRTSPSLPQNSPAYSSSGPPFTERYPQGEPLEWAPDPLRMFRWLQNSLTRIGSQT
jgi:hypothetical protein